jgi:hypothetical protein
MHNSNRNMLSNFVSCCHLTVISSRDFHFFSMETKNKSTNILPTVLCLEEIDTRRDVRFFHAVVRVQQAVEIVQLFLGTILHEQELAGL